MTKLLDITGDVCPMTFVKAKMALDNVAPAGTLCIRLKEEALKNVISALKAGGHSVTSVSREETVFLLQVRRNPAASAQERGNGEGAH